jgi:hypothetical protein
MAQTGYTPILIYSSSTTTNAPAAGNLTNSTLGSELAINITDGKLFYKDNANAIQVIGWKTVPATAGGTGQTSYAVGDILYASSTTALSKLADVATGNALISGGVNTAPAWGKIGLTTHVSGTLPATNGGTGSNSAFTTTGIVYANTTSTLTTGSSFVFDGTYAVGVGVTTSAWGGNYRAYQAGSTAFFGGNTAANRSYVSSNVYWNGSNYKYITSSFATQFEQSDGAFYWLQAASGTAGNNISFATGMYLDTSYNLNVTGNVVMSTSGKGIDFSATPGTGTSELFADYEEGTFTPTYVPAAGAFTSITYNATTAATYTKVGRAVHVVITLRTTAITVGTASGTVAIEGLPFTSASSPVYSSLSLSWSAAFGGDYPSGCMVENSSTKAYLTYRTAVNGTTTFLDVTDLATGVGNYVVVAGTYFV